MGEEISEEEAAMFAAIADHKKIALSVIGCFDSAYKKGFREGKEVGVFIGKNALSFWWWVPAVLVSFCVGAVFAVLLLSQATP